MGYGGELANYFGFSVKIFGIILNSYNNLWIKYLHKLSPQFRDMINHDLTIYELSKIINKSNPTILEIGSNIGQSTEEFLRYFPDVKIYCFEPDQRASDKFKENPKLNGIPLFNLAISEVAKKQEIDFYVSDGNISKDKLTAENGWNQSGSILTPKLHKVVNPWCTFEKKIKVVTNSLDNWGAENYSGFIDLIWMDVQGAEAKVILGAQETLKRTKYLYFEYSLFELYENQLKLREILKIVKDFKIVGIYPRDVLLINKNLIQ